MRRFSDEKLFALKFIKPRDKKEYQKIKNEVAIMNMQGNCILPCIDAYDYSEKLWIFHQLMDVGNFKQIFKERKGRGVIDEKLCKYILKKTVEGLVFLHSQGIIHRDLKSDNILVNSEGEIKLSEFGYQERTSVCYMAPEMVMNNHEFTPKVDVWSLGVFAYEMAMGDPPYSGMPDAKILYNIVSKSPPVISNKSSVLFREFVANCLKKDPEIRPSAQDLLNHGFLREAEDNRE